MENITCYIYIYNLTSIWKKKKYCILKHFLVSVIDTWHLGALLDQTGIAPPRVSWPRDGNEPVHEYYCWFQIMFKKNSGLPMDVESTHVAFNSGFINELNWDLCLLAKRTRITWETMFILELVNLVNQLTSPHTV